MSFFDVIERHGNWVFLKILSRMIVFLILQQIRLILLFVLRVIEGAMHRVDIAPTIPAPPKPPPGRRTTPPAPDLQGEDLAYAAA